MRPIKFRGIDIKGKWHYGLLTQLKEALDSHDDFSTYISNRMGKPLAYNVRPDSIGQFIDLHDKNGVEIYEGDIVRGICSDNPAYVCEGLKQSDMLGKEVTGIVEYSDCYAQFYVTTDGITYLEFKNGITDVEVIGNKYEYND